LRLPGCLLPTDDRSMSGGSSDREDDPRANDCCVGLWNRDYRIGETRPEMRKTCLDAQLRSRAECMTPPVSSSSRRDVSSVSDIRLSAHSRANPLSPLKASWNPRGFFSDRTLSPIARAVKSSRESDASLRIPLFFWAGGFARGVVS
jgi:hypothetical protein